MFAFLDRQRDWGPGRVDTFNPYKAIQFNFPIFAGGAVASRVQEAVYLHRASREVLQRVTRETDRQTRDSYLGVLAEISRERGDRVVVGFAAESHQVLEAARRKLERKACDLMVANDISRRDAGFDTDENAVILVSPGGDAEDVVRGLFGRDVHGAPADHHDHLRFVVQIL